MMFPSPRTAFQLRFRSLFDNARGQVDLDGLSEQARNNYMFARAMVGRELACPEVESTGLG